MVQITNTLVAAAIIVPAIAAPVIESREPKVPFKTIAKVGGKVASGASLGLTVGGLLQGREEIEAREPKFTVSASRVGSIARGAGQAARTAKSGIEFGAAVAPLFPHKQRRDVGEQLETREPKFTSAQAKSFAKGAGAVAHTAKSGIEFGAAVAPLFPHKQRRSLDESDSLEVREPFRLPKGSVRTAGKALAGAAGFAGTVAALNTQQPREFDDSELLEAREPFRLPKGALRHAGHAAAGAAGFAGTVAALNTQQPRDFDDSELDARDPKFNFGKVLGKVASFVLRDDEMDGALYERDVDDSELDARDPKFNFGKALGKVASFVLRDDEIDGALYERDFDDSELDARDPKFNFGKVLGKVASFVLRDDEMDGSLYEREFDDAELLDAREPKFHISGPTLTQLGHDAQRVARFAETLSPLHHQQRDFDDSELLDARDPKFNFGKVLGKVASFVIRDEETGELYVREFDDAELMDAREPEPFFIGSLIKGAAKVAKNFIRDDETGEIYYVREASNMDELD